MKALLVLVLLVALGILYFDDKSQRAAVATMESQAEQAAQAAQTADQQVEQLTNEVDQLRRQANISALGQPAQPVLPAVRPPAAPPSAPPEWFQEHLNGAPTVLDPHAPPP